MNSICAFGFHATLLLHTCPWKNSPYPNRRKEAVGNPGSNFPVVACTQMGLMKTTLFTILFAATVASAQEDSGDITGTIRDKNREPLPGAVLVLLQTNLGAVADENGSFILRAVPSGEYVAQASLLGFAPNRMEGVRVEAGETLVLDVVLIDRAIELQEVKIVGNRQRQGGDDTRTSVKFLEPRAAKVLPGFAEDVLRGVQALPGVVAPSDFSAQLVVRGSGPDQNLIVMDDIEIFNPYRLYGVVSMFNPETVGDVTLLTGGFPARYGDRLSAVLDVTNREGDRYRPVSLNLNLNIANANMVLEGAMPFGVKGSYLFSARRTYYDLIVGPFAKRSGLVGDDVAFPNFSDLQTKLVFVPFDGSKFIFNALRSRDGVDIVSGANRTQPDSVDWMNETNHQVYGLAWHYTPTSNLFSKTVVSYYRNDGETEFAGSFVDPSLDRTEFENAPPGAAGLRLVTVDASSKYVFEKYAVKNEVNYQTGIHSLDGGIGTDVLNTTFIWQATVDPVLRAINQSRGIGVQDRFDEVRSYVRAFAFIQDRINLAPEFSLKPGVRYDYYDLLGKSYLSPRLSASYRWNEVTTLRASYGLFYQSPGYEKVVDTQRPNSGLNDLDERYTRNLEAERSNHIVLGFDRWLTDKMQLTVDGYYKKFDDLIFPTIVQGTRYETSPVAGGDRRTVAGWTAPFAAPVDSIVAIPSNSGNGESYGVEFFLEKKRLGTETRFYGWVSYAWAMSERYQRGKTTPFEFDQRHTVNLVGNVQVNSWLDLGFHWKYGSGFPYTPAVGVRPRILQQSVNGVMQPVVQTNQNGNVIFDVDRGGPENVNSERLPAYHRLDVRATAHTRFWGAHWAFYLDVVNLYNRSNLLNYRYFVNDDGTLGARATSMFPLLPTIGISAKF